MSAKSLFRAVLALVIAANVFGLINVLVNRDGLLRMFSQLRPWMLTVLALLSMASIAACIALWRWRRWGFVLIGAAYLAMLLINLRFGAPPAHTALAPAGLALLLASAWPVRDRFRKTGLVSAGRRSASPRS